MAVTVVVRVTVTVPVATLLVPVVPGRPDRQGDDARVAEGLPPVAVVVDGEPHGDAVAEVDDVAGP